MKSINILLILSTLMLSSCAVRHDIKSWPKRILKGNPEGLTHAELLEYIELHGTKELRYN